MDYFKPAVQLGLTATPKRTINADTYDYFGEPVYVYSLKEGINDGFLTPFKVKQIDTTIDEYLFTSDDTVIEGEIEEGKRYTEADAQFEKALANPAYSARSKTLMAQGLCQERAGQDTRAVTTLLKAYELDARNPIVAYNLSSLLSRRGEHQRAQFYIRRLNNSEWANAESLWLGIKIERALGDAVAQDQLAGQLAKRFSESREHSWYEQGRFNE